MEITVGASFVALVYAGFGCKIAGFLARDELLLRVLMLAGTSCYIAFYLVGPDILLWDLIVTNAILAIVNFAMIGIVVAERTTFSMSTEMVVLYRMFPLMSPGQFRQLIRIAKWVTPGAPAELVREGSHPDELYFVIDGPVEIEKNGETIQRSGGVFIGEIAYLTGQPATATVRVGADASYLCWDRARLEKLVRRNTNLRAALVGHLNMDLARKVAKSQPLPESRVLPAGV